MQELNRKEDFLNRGIHTHAGAGKGIWWLDTAQKKECICVEFCETEGKSTADRDEHATDKQHGRNEDM